MKARLAAVVAALSAAAGLIPLPSGAGQHFGIIGDLVAWGSEGVSASAGSDEPLGGPTEFSSEGFFVTGLGASANTAGPSASLVTLAGCVAVQTPLGQDYGCLSDLRVPPPLSDPTMQQAHINVNVPSAVYPNTFIRVNLTFIGQEPTTYQAVTNDGSLKYRIALAAGRTASLVGFVYSTRVGGHNPDGPGLIAKGAVVQTCSYDGQPCP
ncbi:MAG: hypothetical protein ACRDJM_05715 [Actinomycetota bacterium]